MPKNLMARISYSLHNGCNIGHLFTFTGQHKSRGDEKKKKGKEKYRRHLNADHK
jgi:hypothetical protein